MNLYKIQDYRGALSLYDKILAENPDDGLALDYSGWCLRYMGDWKSAEGRFGLALTALPEDKQSWATVGLGETFLGSEAYEKAAEAFTKAMALAPDDEELTLRCLKGVIWSAWFLEDQPRFDEAVAKLKALDEKMAADVVADVSQATPAPQASRNDKPESEEPEDSLERMDQVISKVISKIISKVQEEPEKVEEEPEKAQEGSEKLQEEPEKVLEEPEEEKSAIWGITLGGDPEVEAEKLREQGNTCTFAEEPDQYGVHFATFSLKESPLPQFLLQDGKPLYGFSYYNGQVLRVNGLVFYEKKSAPLTWIQSQFVGMVEALTSRYGEPEMVRRNGISFEAGWNAEPYMVFLSCNVHLDGASHVEVSYVDREIHRQIMEEVKAQGKKL
mgnify:CR=1 FL=1